MSNKASVKMWRSRGNPHKPENDTFSKYLPLNLAETLVFGLPMSNSTTLKTLKSETGCFAKNLTFLLGIGPPIPNPYITHIKLPIFTN